jgi:hypothetical protein
MAPYTERTKEIYKWKDKQEMKEIQRARREKNVEIKVARHREWQKKHSLPAGQTEIKKIEQLLSNKPIVKLVL